MEHIIIRYGLIAIFLGSGIEGEPFAVAGGILAHRHWISPVVAALAAIGGSWLVDQMWFHLSRHYRHSGVIERIRGHPAFVRSLNLIERHPAKSVVLLRFAYGVRAVAVVAIGASRVPAKLFMPLNLVAAIVWGALFTTLGELFGPGVEAAEARYGSFMAFGIVCLSILVLALTVRGRK